MKFRHLLPTIVVLCLAVRCAVGAERDAVIWLEGCTGFVVEDDLLVTAKHCRHPETLRVTLQGRTVSARRVYVYRGEDGPDVFHLDGGPYTSLPVAGRKPEIGERVYSLGYPGGNWARIEGEIIGGNGVDVNYTNHRIATGNSGGPLLNAKGEVVGVALHVASNIGVHESGFSGWRVTSDAIRTAKQRRSNGEKNPVAPYRRRPVVVVFTSENCGPCEQLKRDVRAGHFADYEFRFIQWNTGTRQWSDPGLYRQFHEACRPQSGALGFPTIWVKGTDQYRVGYSAERRGGLLGWLVRAVEHLIEGIIGRTKPPTFPDSPDFPDQENVPELETPPTEETPPSAQERLVGKLLEDVAALRDEALKTKADLESFKESGVIGKIKALARLKSEKDVALERVEAVKGDVDAIRNRFREHPLQFLWGLLGLVSGLIHRRFAH